MDKEKLSQYQDLLKEIKFLENKIKRLESKKNSVYDKVIASNREFPYQKMEIRVSGHNEEEIKRHKKSLKKRYKKCLKLRVAIENFIKEIPDSRTRMVFEMRYLDSESWLKISRYLGSTDESYARKIHDRYLNKSLDARINT